jgi:membrane fusion protein (multidrug efflux system)
MSRAPDPHRFWVEATIPDDPRRAFDTGLKRPQRPRDYLALADDDADRGRRESGADKSPDPVAERRSHRRRLIIFAVLGATLLLAALGYGAWWWFELRWYASTDDAYTQADSVIIAPRVSGYVAALPVTDNQRVRAGETLLRIDPRPYQAALAQSVANQEKDQANLANAQTIFGRDAAIVKDNLAISHQQYDTDKASVAAGQASVDADKAQVESARLNLEYATIVSPVDGAVGDRSARLGAFVQPGQGLMTIVPMGRAIYVVANFKETQIERMFRGEKVDLSIDTFAGVRFTGTVDSLAPGSGAQFALLPPENATGNFTKIVQRVPVKILIDNPPPDRLDQLRPGLSVEASVDSRTAPREGERQTLVPLAAPNAGPAP